MSARRLSELNRRIVACTRCPRLREHCVKTAREKRASFRDWDYWGKPVPNFGAVSARPASGDKSGEGSGGITGGIAGGGGRSGGGWLLVVGLAPAAHGANRTGRMFTGDRSGDFLYREMFHAGFASQPHALRLDDGLKLRNALITAAAHCAPPGNKPSGEELENCAGFLDDTFDVVPGLRVVLCLGGVAMDAVLRLYRRRGWIERRAPYRFAHGAEYAVDGAPTLLCSYHPSQQNTFTGRLTERMLREVFLRAAAILDAPRDH